jgi:hypothetical protein
MTQFLRVDSVDEHGETGPELVNVDEIATVVPIVGNGGKCIIYLRNLRTLTVTQSLTWFESKLKTRAP